MTGFKAHDYHVTVSDYILFLIVGLAFLRYDEMTNNKPTELKSNINHHQ